MSVKKNINLLFLLYTILFMFNVNSLTVNIQYLLTTFIVALGFYIFLKSKVDKNQISLFILIIFIFIFKFYHHTFKLSVFISFISSLFIFTILDKVIQYKKYALMSISVGIYLILTMIILYFPAASLNSLDYTRFVSKYIVHSLFSDDFRSTDMMPYLTIALFAFFLFLKIKNKKSHTFFYFFLLLFPILKFDKSNLWMIYFILFILTLIPNNYYKYINYILLFIFLSFPILVIKFSVLYDDDYLANLITSGRIEIWSSASTELYKNFPFNFLFGVGHDFKPFMITPFSDIKSFDEVSYHSGLFRFMAQDGYLIYFFSCLFLFLYIIKIGEYGTYILLLILLYNLFDGSFFTNFTFYPLLIFPFFILKLLTKTTLHFPEENNSYRKITN